MIFNGVDLMQYSLKKMRTMWGPEMAMIFQDPMTSLNPVMKVGKQITEGMRVHFNMEKSEANEHALALCVTWPSPSRHDGSRSSRTSCRAACASAS